MRLPVSLSCWPNGKRLRHEEKVEEEEEEEEKGGGGIGRYGRLKNSRKLFSPHLEKGDPPTSGDTKLDKVQVSDGVPPVSTDSGAALTSSARHRNKTVLCTEQPDTLWEQLMLTMKTVNMEGTWIHVSP